MRDYEVPCPPPEKRTPRVVIPKPGKVYRCVLLGGRMAGVLTHWWEEKTIVCEGLTSCPGCLAGRARRWTGYRSARWLYSGVCFVFRITPAMLDSCSVLGLGEETRGLMVDFGRMGVHRTSSIWAQTKGELSSRQQETLCPAFDVRPILDRMFSTTVEEIEDETEVDGQLPF